MRVFFTNKTDCHDITEILLKVALNTSERLRINVCLDKLIPLPTTLFKMIADIDKWG
jgi:hypothetical protein